jgi:uncharacterized membrane protein
MEVCCASVNRALMKRRLFASKIVPLGPLGWKDRIAIMMSSRVASLSDNVFGVAMTLLAADVIPASVAADGATWTVLRAEMLPRILVMVLSFAIAGTYWVSHHRRLAVWTFSGPFPVYANMLFLLSIVLLPVTSRLYGQSASLPAHILFGIDLAAIAVLNAALWLIATWDVPWTQRRRWVGPSALMAGWFVMALLLLVVDQYAAQIMWMGAFAMPVIAGRMIQPGGDPPVA